MSGLAMTAASTPSEPAPQVQLKLADALKRAQEFYAKGHLKEAERYATAIIAKHPKHAMAFQVLAGVAEKRGQKDQALELLQASLSGANTDALALMNMCRLLRIYGRFEESRQAGERAVAIGALPEALVDLADTYTALAEPDRALELFERAVAIRPNLARAHMGLAQALLLKGDFRAGWAEYEWRYKLAGTQNLLPKFKQPQWNGMKLKSSKLLIICEQGFGDCFQFARYLPLVSERVKDVFIGAGAELSAIIQRVKGSHICYERWEDIPAFEFQITLSSLPLVFGTTIETIPGATPYLFPDAAKAQAWRARLAARAEGRKTVGLVWQGRPTHPNDKVRSVALDHLTRLLELDGVLPVSLQVGAGRDQLEQHPARARVLDAADDLKTFDDTAALASQLDCVVSIDSAIAHLAGGLGKTGYVMLPKAGEWRWLQGRTDSPWYPTLELVRQDASATWDSVVTRIIDRIRA
jgi:tetratricopeptide (TPR) repeat protein